MSKWIELLAERVTRTYQDTPTGHAARINGLTNEEARELCSLLRNSLGPSWDVMVVSHHPSDGLEASLDLAIERRNNKSQSRLFIVPADLVAEAAASLADTEAHDVTEYLKAIADRLYRQLPPQVKGFVGAVIKRTPASVRLDYLCSLPQDPSTEACGREMWRLGLIPDLNPTEDRLTINRATVGTLSDLRRASGSLHQLVEMTGLGDEDLKQSLTEVLRETGTDNPQMWLRRIAEDDFALSFDRWNFPKVDQVDLQSLEVHSFRDPRKNKAYTWSGLTLEDETLKVSTADKKAKVTVRWSTKPETPTGEPLYEVSLDTADAQPSPLIPLVIQKHKKGRTQSWSFRPSDIEEAAGGTLRVKVTVRSYIKERDEWLTADSDEFLLVSETIDDPVRLPTSPARSLPDFMLERAIATKAVPQITQQVVEGGAIKVELDERQRRKLLLTTVLQTAERKMLEDPNPTAPLSLLLSENTQWKPEDLRIPNSETQEGAAPDWKSKRRRLFAKMAQALEGKGVVAGCELSTYKDDILSYCRSYASALEELLETSGDPDLAYNLAALTHLDSIQVQEEVGDGKVLTVGILLSPLHPLRLLWHLSHEALIKYWMEQAAEPGVKAALPPAKAAEQLDGSNFPAFIGALTSSHDQTLFYLGDTPLFHWPLYISAREQNPHRVRTLVRRALGLATAEAATAGDEAAAQALKGSLAAYYELHPYVSSLKLTAVNPGDGGLLVRALSALEDELREKSTAAEEDSVERELALEVRLYGPPPLHQIGSVLDECAALRHRGQGLPLKLDWLFRSGVSFLRPHLFWAKRDLQRVEAENGEMPAESHLSFVTDYFRPQPAFVPHEDDRIASVSTYGLQTDISGEFRQVDGRLSWMRAAWLPDGSRLAAHPSDRRYTKELIRLHDLLLKAAARLSGGADGDWPAVEISVSESQFSLFSRLHETSDWVVTVDRNMGVEIFDSPALRNEGLAENAKRYLIDYSPTQVTSGQQLMVSTAWMDEVNELMRETLRGMLIAPSDLACEEVLRLLKSISGRLVMRVARQPDVAKEAVSLAVVREVLRGRGELSNAFLVPIDEHIPLFVGAAKAKGSDTLRRPDLMLVRPRLDKKASIEVDFIEVKYRRHRAMAYDPRLWGDILEAVSAGEEKLSRVYFPRLPEKELELPLRRRQLKIALSFYVERAVRHGLIEWETAQKIEQWFEQFQREDLTLEAKKRGFIYCPELNFDVEEQTYEGMSLTLIGRDSLPRYTSFHVSEISAGAPTATALNSASGPVASRPQTQPAHTQAEATPRPRESATGLEPTAYFPPLQGAQEEIRVNIGEDTQLKSPVYFNPSIRGNPHALIVGIPGMGKTKAIFNLCRGLARQEVNPFIIDFHGDLATDLQSDSGGRPCRVLDASAGLPFNPLEVDSIRRKEVRGWIAHYFEVAEILGAIFPSFGELQVGSIRDVLRTCYEQSGFSASPHDAPAPSFLDFWRQLQARAESERELKKIAARLEGVFQLGLFQERQEETFSLGEILSQVTVLDLHRLDLEENQRIAASFFLQRIYRDMFSRPVADRLRTAVVFDEAHRVARLRLIPKMMQECRKYGIMFIVSSQRAEDFDQGVLDSARNHLYLCLNNPDARRLAAYIGGGTARSELVDKLQTLPKFHALFRSEEHQPFVSIRLAKP